MKRAIPINPAICLMLLVILAGCSAAQLPAESVPLLPIGIQKQVDDVIAELNLVSPIEKVEIDQIGLGWLVIMYSQTDTQCIVTIMLIPNDPRLTYLKVTYTKDGSCNMSTIDECLSDFRGEAISKGYEGDYLDLIDEALAKARTQLRLKLSLKK